MAVFRGLALISLCLVTPLSQVIAAESEAEADRFAKSLPQDPAAAARLINQHYQDQGLTLSFWPDPNRKPLHDEVVAASACGNEIYARTLSIPPPNRGLSGDPVYEIDKRGRRLSKWQVPSNGHVLGLSGDSVLVPFFSGYRGDLFLAISSTGAYRVVPVDTSVRRLQPATCPAVHPMKASVYAICGTIREANRTRYFVFQGPCT